MLEDKWPTPVKIQVLQDYLLQSNYDSQEIEYLVDGFSVFSEKFTAQVNCPNLRSALERPEIVKEKICKELLAGRVAGPFLHRPCESFNVSPLGLCPKKEKNKFRLIFHLSHPHGDSVNDFIPQEFSTVHYTNIADAINGIKTFDTCFLAKTDISMAYRNLPLKPQEYHLLGFKWNDLFYYDRCRPMGCSSSCQIFERFSTGLHNVGQMFMPNGMMFHILDDFFNFGSYI